MLFFGRRKEERRSTETLSRGADRRSCKDRRTGPPRRKRERYKAKEGIFVEIKDSVVKMGQILDVSKGGLAFHYIDIGKRPKKSFELEILVKNNGFHLEDLQLKTITDLAADSEFSFSYIPLRRRGGQFNNLSQHQIFKLEYFIMHHTLGIV